jgi:hypothetical protein
VQRPACSLQTVADERTNLHAPVGSIDLAAFDDAGEPYTITACHDCLPWHAEVIRGEDEDILVREWHAIGCPLFQELIARPD